MENVFSVALGVLREDKKSKQQAVGRFPQHLLSKPKRDKEKKLGSDSAKAEAAAPERAAETSEPTPTVAPTGRNGVLAS